MSVIFIVLPLALLVALVAVVAFMRSARGGQFDDLDTPSVRMLLDDAEVVSTGKSMRNAPGTGDAEVAGDGAETAGGLTAQPLKIQARHKEVSPR